jgi:ArsR family transcriptional regulator
MLSTIQYSAEYCSRRLKAIADPTRWSVLLQLMDGSMTVGELNVALGLDLTLLSHHLRTLRDEGFVESVVEGKSRRYLLSEKVKLNADGRGLDLGCCHISLKDGTHA